MIRDGSALGWSKEDGLFEKEAFCKGREVDDMSDGPGFSELLSSVGLDRDRNGVYDVCLTMMNLALWLAILGTE